MINHLLVNAPGATFFKTACGRTFTAMHVPDKVLLLVPAYFGPIAAGHPRWMCKTCMKAWSKR